MLRIQPTVSATILSVQIEVENQLKEPIYINNWLWDWFGMTGVPELDKQKNNKAPPTRQLAFVCVGKHGELVVLNGDGPGPPLGVSVFYPRRPEATRVQPGDTLRWELRLPLPLCEWYAYKRPTTTDAVPVSVTKLRYQLQSLRHSVCPAAPAEHGNHPGVFVARGYPPDLMEATAVLTPPITVLRRTDPEFERFGDPQDPGW